MATARTGSPVAADRESGHDRAIPEDVVGRRPLVALPPAQEAPVVEHVLGEGIEGPVVALARVAGLARYLDEAVVEREVVPDGVLPGGELVVVVGEPRHYELADAAEGELLLGRLEDRHRYEGYVRVWGLYQRRRELVRRVVRALVIIVVVIVVVVAAALLRRRHHGVRLLVVAVAIARRPAASPRAVIIVVAHHCGTGGWYGRQVVLVEAHRVDDHAAAVGVAVAVGAAVARRVRRHHHGIHFHVQHLTGCLIPCGL